MKVDTASRLHRLDAERDAQVRLAGDGRTRGILPAQYHDADGRIFYRDHPRHGEGLEILKRSVPQGSEVFVYASWTGRWRMCRAGECGKRACITLSAPGRGWRCRIRGICALRSMRS
jgi:hypothetical protein